MGQEFAIGEVTWCKSAPLIRNEADLNLVMVEMERRVLALNLHEFFLCTATDKLQVRDKLEKASKLELNSWSSNFKARKEEFLRDRLVFF